MVCHRSMRFLLHSMACLICRQPTVKSTEPGTLRIVRRWPGFYTFRDRLVFCALFTRIPKFDAMVVFGT